MSVLFVVAGVVGQVLFFARTAWQWLSSERAGAVVIPKGYWWVSLAASLMVLVYAASTLDPVFVAGPVVSSLVFASNLLLGRRTRQGAPEGGRAGTPLVALVPAALLLFALVGLTLSGKLRVFDLTSVPVGWIAVGACGQALWLSRNVVQWWASSRLGQSVLPASYFLVSSAGALLLLAYAVYRVDWVFMLAYAFNTIPYTRNLMLLWRARRQPAVPAAPALESALEPALPREAA